MTDATDIARQRRLLAAVIAGVVVGDQLVKWWTWRHVDGVLINSGGYILLGSDIRAWFATPVGGAVADVVGTVALIVAVVWLTRRPRPTGVLIGGALVVGGWTSNILDRLGLHNVTAPGSARGVVDFIPDGTPGRSNTADVCIALGAVLLGYTIVRRRWIGERRDRNPPGLVPSVRARIAVMIVLLAVIALAVTSALDHDGVHAPNGAGKYSQAAVIGW
jgi:lipoprotein signal peptidase